MANLVIYIIYIILSITITWHVGIHLHRHGRQWVINALTDENLSDRMNDMLLILYRLFNIGYLMYTMMAYPMPHGIFENLYFLSNRFGLLLLMLAYLHYQNIFLLLVFSSTIKTFKK